MLLTIIAFILILMVIIFIHELGHFLLAKYHHVKVLEFSLGFGKVIFQKKYGDTTYFLKLIPLGGYVKMLNDNPSLTSEEREKTFESSSLLAKYSIISAGPLFNFILAFFIYFIIANTGEKVLLPIINNPTVNSIAFKSGLLKEDMITHIDNKYISDFNDLNLQVLNSAISNKIVNVTVKRGIEYKTLKMDFTKFNNNLINKKNNFISEIGIFPIEYNSTYIINNVVKNSPADKNDIRINDVILNINKFNTNMSSMYQISKSVNKKIEIEILRKENNKEYKKIIYITPENKDGKGYIGISFNVLHDENDLNKMFINKRYNFYDSILSAAHKTKQNIVFTIDRLIDIVKFKISPENISGPISTAHTTSIVIEYGFIEIMKYIAIISISVGIFNLIPLPVLDGGHLLIYTIEYIKGSALSEKTLDFVTRFGIFFIVTISCVTIFNDIKSLL